MGFVWAGMLAAGVAFIINRLGVGLIGLKAIIFFVPLIEELAKTLSAYYFSVSILLTHLVFGLIEAGYDFFTSPKKGLTAGLISIVGHSFFGWMTTLAYFYSNNILIGLVAGLSVHMIWNGVVMKFLVR